MRVRIPSPGFSLSQHRPAIGGTWHRHHGGRLSLTLTAARAYVPKHAYVKRLEVARQVYATPAPNREREPLMSTDEFEWIHTRFITTRKGKRLDAKLYGRESWYIRVRKRTK